MTERVVKHVLANTTWDSLRAGNAPLESPTR